MYRVRYALNRRLGKHLAKTPVWSKNQKRTEKESATFADGIVRAGKETDMAYGYGESSLLTALLMNEEKNGGRAKETKKVLEHVLDVLVTSTELTLDSMCTEPDVRPYFLNWRRGSLLYRRNTLEAAKYALRKILEET